MKILSFYEMLEATFQAQVAFNSVGELMEYAGPIYKVKQYSEMDLEVLDETDIDLGQEVGFIFEANLLDEKPQMDGEVYTIKNDNGTYRFEPILFSEV